MKRREFLKAGAVATAAPFFVPSSVFGANAPSNRITIGCIGLGGMGRSDLRAFLGQPDAQIVALCDVDTRHLAEAEELAEVGSNNHYTDFRELLLRQDIDAVTVVTPDHWHVPISIAAAKAGKDIYTEKPLTLTIGEGRALAQVVRRYGRILQTGSQQRSDERFRFACELVRNQRIGELREMRVEIPPNNRFCPPEWKPEPIPAELDYDMWLGPAPWEPYTTQRCHYQFRFVLDYSGGQMTNWGAHALDIAQWAIGADESGPVEIAGKGEFPESGLFNTATKVDLVYTYDNGVALSCKTGNHFNLFIGSEGWVRVQRGAIDAHPKSLLTSIIRPDEIRLERSPGHHQNFLECVRQRRDPIAHVEVGHRSATVCHLGNIAMLLGRTLKWDPKDEAFIGDRIANNMRNRVRRAPWFV